MTDMSPPSPSPEISSVNAREKKRGPLFLVFFLVLVLCAGGAWLYWDKVASRHVETDNAYVGADIAQVTSAISGIVKSVLVSDTQTVKAGDVLVVLDDTDAQLALNRAQADDARAQAERERAQIDLDRRSALVTSGSISAEELSNAENAFKSAKANQDAAQAALEQARTDLQRTIIHAPLDGVVAHRQVQLGQHINAGTTLLSVVPLQDVYVDANFKEVQLRKVKVGQTATLHADLYGSKVEYHGKVVGLAGGTGAVFALIPAQNATGNWIKVVQRLPVRIALDRTELAAHPLQVGLSMSVDIDISK